MQKSSSLTVESFSAYDKDEHRVTTLKGIKQILQSIVEHGTYVALYFGGDGQFVLSTLLEVDDDGMWMEQSRDSRLNAGALRSNRLVFVSSHLGIKIQFRVSQISEALYEGEPAFYLPMPDALLRLQRRDTFRIATPTINPLLCVLPSSAPGKQPARKRAIMDISVGGVRLACNEEDTDLVYGQSFDHCTIELPEVGTLKVTLTVRNEVDVSRVPGKVLRRVGCQFKNLDQHDQVMLQRYITELQRAQRAKE